MSLINVHIVTGFLGVGKTSCIQNLIKNKPAQERWAILVNEYGQKGIDGQLLHSDEVLIKQISGGCACCAALLPFQTALNQLIRHEKLDRIIIEPSGLGHVDNIVQLLKDESYRNHLQINGVVCVIDSRHLSQPKYRYHELYLRQLYAADLLVANKSELASDNDIKLFEQLAKDFKRPAIHIANAQLTLENIQCELIEKHKPFQIHNKDLSFYTEVMDFEGKEWQLENLMNDLANLKLTRIKGLLVQADQVAAINISETEQSLSYFPLSVMKNAQHSVIECIDNKAIEINKIQKMINKHRLN